MTISRLDMKVSEVCIALGAGTTAPDIVNDMLNEGFPQVIVDRIMAQARSMLKDMGQEEVVDERVLHIQQMISEALDNIPR